MLTFEEVQQIFESTPDYDTVAGDSVFKGLLILAKYIDPDKKQIIEWCGDDEMASVDVDDAIEAGATKEDFEQLARLGWFISDTYLSHFV